MNTKKTWVNLKMKATKNKNSTFFPYSSRLTFWLEKLLKNIIEPITVIIKINSNVNILKGSKIKEKELFSSNLEAFSDDLKINLSNEEFNKEVVAAMKRAPSTTVFNFNFTRLNLKGSSDGLLRLIINSCFKSILFQFP